MHNPPQTRGSALSTKNRGRDELFHWNHEIGFVIVAQYGSIVELAG